VSVGYPDWGGSPNVNAPVNVFNASGLTVGPANQGQLGPFNVSGQSYTIKFDPTQGSGGVAPFPELEVICVDGVNFATDDVLYEMIMSPTAGDCEFVCKGPLNGTQLYVNVDNNDSVTMTYSISIDQNNTPLLAHTCKTVDANSIGGGYTLSAGIAPRKGILGMGYRSALGAGASDNYILPPAPGLVAIGLQAVTAADVIHILTAPMVNQSSYTGISGGLMDRVYTDANGNAKFTTYFPRSSIQLNITNAGAGATDYRWSAIYDISQD